MVPDLYNQLRVDLDESVAPGTVASVKFRDRIFMEVTAVERLAVKSVNGSTSIPLPFPVRADDEIDLSVEFSHDDYVSTLDDYIVSDPSLATISLIGENLLRVAVASDASRLSYFSVYAIETEVAIFSII